MSIPRTTQVLPLYGHYFNNVGTAKPNWNDFNSQPADLVTPLSDRAVDFSVQDGKPKDWSDVAKDIASILIRIVLFPIGIRDLTRYILQRIVMLPLYPAQSRIFRLFSPIFKTDALNEKRKKLAEAFKEYNYIVRDVVLEKNGVRYSGWMIGLQSTIDNGNWVVQAGGNIEFFEYSSCFIAPYYAQADYNTLFMHGPAVGKSQGHATPKSMGDAQEVGISFLETALKAKKIVMAGRSLGGAAMSEAIMQHTFKPEVKYLAVSQMTFGRASTICGKITGQIAKIFETIVPNIIKWSGCEMDEVAAARRLHEKGIKQVIVQASTRAFDEGEIPQAKDIVTDGPIMADASLTTALVTEGVTENKVFIGLPYADHVTSDAFEATLPEIRKL